MLISETFLKPSKTFRIQNYQIYRTDRTTGRGGGTAILIKQGITHEEIETESLQSIENTGIRIKTRNGDLICYAVYNPPGTTITDVDIKKLFRHNIATIAAGDLNAKHRAWNSRVTNAAGKQLLEIANENDLIIAAPSEHTHLCTGTNTTDLLDIAVIQNVRWAYRLETIMDLSSDHLPVILELETGVEEKRRTIMKTNWLRYKERLRAKKRDIQNTEQLEEAIEDIENRIKNAVEEATTTTEVTSREPIPKNLKILLIQKRSALRKYRRTLHPEDKKILNKRTQEVKEQLREHRTKEWDKKLESLESENTSLWQMAQQVMGKKTRRRMPRIVHTGGVALTDADKAEVFATHLESQFTNNPENQDVDVNFNMNVNRIGTRIETPNENEEDDEIEEISESEIQDILKNLKTRKAPGPDGIKNQALKYLPEEAIQEITEIARGVFRTEQFPKIWKEAVTIMLHKYGKPTNEANSYRPISLLPALSKVIERTLYKRLKSFADSRNILPDHQFGFRTEHSTIYQLARMTEDIKDKLNISIPTGAIFLDIEKAFDKVWHHGLIYKLKRDKFPRKLVNIVQAYLSGRTFRVRIGDQLSSIKEVHAGVPQGSVIGPLLYNIYTADIKTPEKCKIAQFADDTALYISSRRKEGVQKGLQEDLLKIHKYFEKWKIKVNPIKTVGVYFDHKRREKNQRTSFSTVIPSNGKRKQST
ncbi:hypothetical protein WA026_021104 [Henosepilachna vigintioctopunctata]|uniref:Reverse transcriptase domain-containing protein n=1 Tax=Henosepilachna vigintioctopunctata TaxID=420089 RepID=A0AAW1V389_9CUCU